MLPNAVMAHMMAISNQSVFVLNIKIYDKNSKVNRIYASPLLGMCTLFFMVYFYT
jgi:hypothetical protein